MHHLRSRGSSLLGHSPVANFKRKVLNSWVAFQDTFFSTKEIFERHKVVFTVGTSIASVATALVGYSLRHHHESKVQERLESLEKVISRSRHLEEEEFKKLVNAGSYRTAAWIATAGTTFIVGYGLGWRGGQRFATRKFRKEQLKLVGQLQTSPRVSHLLGRLKSKALKFQSFRRQFARIKGPDGILNGGSAEAQKSC